MTPRTVGGAMLVALMELKGGYSIGGYYVGFTEDADLCVWKEPFDDRTEATATFIGDDDPESAAFDWLVEHVDLAKPLIVGWIGGASRPTMIEFSGFSAELAEKIGAKQGVAHEEGMLPPDVPFFGRDVDFRYVAHLRGLLGLRRGQSLTRAIAELVRERDALSRQLNRDLNSTLDRVIEQLEEIQGGLRSIVSDLLANHDTCAASIDCWCRPTLYLPCEDCADESYAGVAVAHLPALPTEPAGCWKCEHGIIRTSRDRALGARADDPAMALIVVHDLRTEARRP